MIISFFNACDLRPRNKSKSRKANMLDLIDILDLLDILGSLTWFSMTTVRSVVFMRL